MRIRSLLPASVLLMMTGAVLFMAPAGPSTWTAVSAQGAPKSVPSDRIYLKIEGVEGEATESEHVGDLLVQSFTWTESRPDPTSKIQMKEFHVTALLDKSSPVLMRKTAVKERIGKAVLSVRNTLGQDYTRWTLGDIILTSFTVEGTAGQGRPIVSFDMAFTKIDVEVRAQLFNGGLSPAVKASWDAKVN